MPIDDIPDLSFDVPDFSGDDFKDVKWIQEKRRLEAEFNKMMNDSIKLVTGAFNAKESSHRNLKHFLLHKSVSLPFISSSYEGKWKNKEIYFCIFNYQTFFQAGRLYQEGDDNYFAGVFDLEKTYPHTIAQPETLRIKIEDLFLKTDVDFENSKRFSRKFHVICENQEALRLLLFNKDLNRIADHPCAEFELHEKQCYFRTGRKPVSIEEAEEFVELGKILLEVL